MDRWRKEAEGRSARECSRCPIVSVSGMLSSRRAHDGGRPDMGRGVSEVRNA